MNKASDVAFLGLGAMGLGLATNLQKKLDSDGAGALAVWNRSKEKCKPLIEAGAQVLDSPAAAAKKAITFTMLFDDAAVEQTFHAWLSGSPAKGAVWVSCTTCSPHLVKELAAEADKAGVLWVSAPVFGRPDAAREHRVLFAVAGHDCAKAKLTPYLEAMGRGIVDLGEQPHLAQVQKLVGNFMIVGFVELLSEAMALAEAAGLPRQNVANVAGNLFPGPIAPGYIKRLAAEDFDGTSSDPGFPVAGGLKDVGLMLQLAKEAHAELPTGEVMYKHLKSAEAAGLSSKDWTALSTALKPKNAK